MTKANECTCPSGDGSLRHPCPAHPASVELAGVAANLTFINGRPAMCGCQVEYSSGGGEYSDVIYVTLCAKHSGSAILDLVATNRIALTPEYEGQWHADLYLDREIPLAKAEGATPAEAVLALMSAERIDPEQESVEQAGGDERAAFEAAASKLGIYTCNFERYTEETAAHENRINARVEDPVRAGDYRSATLQDCWKVWQEARAALVQHSPAPTLRAAIDIANDRFEAPVAKWGTDLAGEEERPEIEEVSEFEREDIARSAFETAMADGISLDSFLSLSNTLAARYERIVGALRFERQQMDRAFIACINERDAANARLHEVATACATAEQERDAALARVAELENGTVYVEARQCYECHHGGINDSADGLAACHDCDWTGPEPDEDKCPGCHRENCMAAACPECGGRYELVADANIAAPPAQAQHLHDLDKQCRDDVARALGLRPNEERGFAWSYLLASIKSCVKAAEDTAQAQHSVPEGWMLVECGIWTQEQVDEMQKTVARFRNSEFVDDRALAMAVADAGQCKAPEISLAELLAAAPGKEGV
ncbi:TPA: hypothetical protein NOZ58_003165 [Pseudomonas aeruginosa]|nr:hypothetical protein [Pseudomonas aeruginosa]